MKPDTTFIIARIIGPLCVVAGMMLISEHARMRAMIGDFLGNDALMAFTGFTMLALGLTLLALHQRWDSITAAIVSLIAWLTLARGVVLLLRPSLVRDAGVYVLTQPLVMPIAGCVIALIGVWLSYAGYIAGTLRAETSRS
jgi:hypothetical protein